MRFCPAHQNAPQELKPQVSITLPIGWFPLFPLHTPSLEMHGGEMRVLDHDWVLLASAPPPSLLQNHTIISNIQEDGTPIAIVRLGLRSMHWIS